MLSSPYGRVSGHLMYVEFLGIPRERAGISELEVEADTLGQLLDTLAARFPAFGELITAGRPASVDRRQPERRRVRPRPGRPCWPSDDRLLILSADAGG